MNQTIILIKVEEQATSFPRSITKRDNLFSPTSGALGQNLRHQLTDYPASTQLINQIKIIQNKNEFS